MAWWSAPSTVSSRTSWTRMRRTVITVVTVSGGGGYYVKGAVSELEMGDVQPGQTVTVRSMESDMSYEGEVVSVSDYPTTENNSWTNGNSNVSFYPLTVFIDESAELRENEYGKGHY